MPRQMLDDYAIPLLVVCGIVAAILLVIGGAMLIRRVLNRREKKQDETERTPEDIELERRRDSDIAHQQMFEWT